MPDKERDSLFALIHSLSKAEIKFVKDFTILTRKKSEGLIRLMDAIRKQKKSDKEALENEFNGEFNKLTNAKFHLKQCILKAMRSMRDGKNIESVIFGHFQDYLFLYENGIYKESLKSLEKAKQEAIEHEKFAYLIEIIRVEKHRLMELERKGSLPELITGRNMEQEAVLDSLMKEMRVINYYHQVFSIYREGEEGLRVEEPMGCDRIDDPEAGYSFISRLYFHMAKSIIARSDGDFEKMRSESAAALSIIEENDKMRIQMPLKHRLLLVNYVLLSVEGREFEEARKGLEKLENIPDHNFNEKAEKFQNVAILRLLLVLNSKEYDRLPELISFLENGLEVYDRKINQAREFTIWFNLILLYFVKGEFRMARKWCEKILDHKKFKVRREAQYVTRLIILVINFELGHSDILDDALIATRRFLERNDKLTVFEKVVLRNLKKLISKPDATEQKAVLLMFKEQLLELSENSESDQKILGLRVLLEWIDGKFARQVA